MSMNVLVTESSGLIGSEAVRHFSRIASHSQRVDNNMRADIIGPSADASWTLKQLKRTCPNFEHHSLDIRDRTAMMRIVAESVPNLIIHCAAQPPHDFTEARRSL
jgi:CDP-paratose 2-epimerase